MNGNKPGPASPLPRPHTAIDRLRAQQRQKTHDSLVRRLLPWKSDN